VTVTTPWVDASKRLQLINTLAAGIVVSHWMERGAYRGDCRRHRGDPERPARVGAAARGLGKSKGGGPLARRDIGACRAAPLALIVSFPTGS
jgi:hypothetical protein